MFVILKTWIDVDGKSTLMEQYCKIRHGERMLDLLGAELYCTKGYF